MKKLAFALLILTVAVPSIAEKIIPDTDKHYEQGNKLLEQMGITAESLQAPAKSTEFAKEVERYSGMIKNNLDMAEEIADKTTFDTESGVVSFDAPSYKSELREHMEKEKIIQPRNQYALNEDERLYVFISLSMPANILKTYCDSMNHLNLGKGAVFVIRGCVPGGGWSGCEDFRLTANFVQSFIKGGCQVWIDPILFRTYEVAEVPVVVYANGISRVVDMGSEGDYERLITAPAEILKSIGDWSLEYHITELAKQTGATSLKKISNIIAEEDTQGDK